MLRLFIAEHFSTVA